MEGFLLDAAPSDDGLLQTLGPEMLARLQGLYEKYETDLEIEFAAKILAGEAKLEDYPMHERFVRLVSGEAELAGIKPEHKVLFIGSGPFPISPILFAKLTGAHVDCLDMSKEACEISEQVVEKLGLQDQITIINGEGESADVGEHDVVVVALLAQPKDRIAFNLKLQNPESTPVVVRWAPGNRKVFYRGFDPTIEDRVRRYSFPIFEGRYHRAGTDDTISSSLSRVRKSIEKF